MTGAFTKPLNIHLIGLSLFNNYMDDMFTYFQLSENVNYTILTAREDLVKNKRYSFSKMSSATRLHQADDKETFSIGPFNEFSEG